MSFCQQHQCNHREPCAYQVSLGSCDAQGTLHRKEVICQNWIPRSPLQATQLKQQMNKTEARYASLLEGLKLSGEIADYAYEPIKLVIGPDCTLTPDFLVQLSGRPMIAGIRGLILHPRDCRIVHAAQKSCEAFDAQPNHGSPEASLIMGELRDSISMFPILQQLHFHETKGGFTREDSLVKLKSAAQQFPWFRFKLCRYHRGEWAIKEIR